MRLLTSVVLSLPLVGAYAIFAVGIVLIYRASRVLNLAHGAMAMIPAYLTYSLVRGGVPTPIAFVLSLGAGAGLGLAVERIFVRRLRAQSATAQTVGTVAALGILIAVAAKVWGTTPREAVRIFPKGFVTVGSSGIQLGEIGLFVVMCAVTAALYILLQRTDLGLMMRGAAESRLGAALHGVNPDRIAELTWALGGGLAALAGILLAAVTNLNPYVLSLQALPGFIAALLGGLGSLPGAVAGAAGVGVAQGLVPVMGAFGRAQGAPQLLLAVLVVAVMAARGKAVVGVAGPRDGLEGGDADSGPEVPGGGRPRGALGQRLLWHAGAAAVVAFPWLAPLSLVGSANLAAAYALVAISIVMLTGWVGQISLGHAALVGVGAYLTGWAAGGAGIPFPFSVLFAAAAAGGAAVLLGVVALRVRGLYLAVATLVFNWMASEFLFRQGWFTKHDQIPARAIGGAETFPSFDFTDRRVFYLLAWAFVAAAAYGALNLRDSKFGRAFFAVRGSEVAAASLGIDVTRIKLVAFAVSGVVAGAAGNLLMSDARVVSQDQFGFIVSLFLLSVAVVGGLSSVGGAISSGLLFAGLTELFFRVPALGGLLEIVSAFLLVVVLLVYPGGLASLPGGVRRLAARLAVLAPARRLVAGEPQPRGQLTGGLLAPPGKRTARALAGPTRFGRVLRGLPSRRLARHRPLATLTGKPPIHFGPVADSEAQPDGHKDRSDIRTVRSPVIEARALGPRGLRRHVLEAEHVTVRFGGLVAVNDASLAVHEGEIVGLIGPNGAGKTTLFNAIAGFNSPVSGVIRLYDRDVTRLPMHRRAAIGVARTFQLIQLFGSLTVFENLLVATHVHNPTGLFHNLVAAERALAEERAARARVTEVLELLELSDIAHHRAGSLPFGVLRMVEVARALVTGFPVAMLDEPASGLDNAETDRLMEVLRFVRGLGVTQLLIEHDVRMVTGVSDYMYVLDQGRMIAEGVPEAIQRDPLVVAAYLGEPATEGVG